MENDASIGHSSQPAKLMAGASQFGSIPTFSASKIGSKMVHWAWIFGAYLGGLMTAWVYGTYLIQKKKRLRQRWMEENADLENIKVVIGNNGRAYFYRGGDLMTASLIDENTINTETIAKVDFDNIDIEEMMRVSNAIELLKTR